MIFAIVLGIVIIGVIIWSRFSIDQNENDSNNLDDLDFDEMMDYWDELDNDHK